jgi:hypothetical protein
LFSVMSRATARVLRGAQVPAANPGDVLRAMEKKP